MRFGDRLSFGFEEVGRTLHAWAVNCGTRTRTVAAMEKQVSCRRCLHLLRRRMARKRIDGLPTQKRGGMTKAQKVLLFIAASPDGRFHW